MIICILAIHIETGTGNVKEFFTGKFFGAYTEGAPYNQTIPVINSSHCTARLDIEPDAYLSLNRASL